MFGGNWGKALSTETVDDVVTVVVDVLTADVNVRGADLEFNVEVVPATLLSTVCVVAYTVELESAL